MNGIKIELYKLFKAKFFWIAFLSYIVITSLLLFQMLINENSGVYDLNLAHPFQIASLLMLVALLFSNIWAVIIGSYLGGSDYDFKTWSLLFIPFSKTKLISYKLFSLLLISIVTPIALLVIGLGIGLFFHEAHLNEFGFTALFIQLTITILTFVILGLFGFFLAFAFKNVATGNAVAISILMLSLFFGTLIPYINFLSPQWYLIPFYEQLFNNQSDGSSIDISSTNFLSNGVNIFILLIAASAQLFIIYFLAKIREFA